MTTRLGDDVIPYGEMLADTASAFHAFDLGATACAMGAIESGFDAERLVFDVLERLSEM